MQHPVNFPPAAATPHVPAPRCMAHSSLLLGSGLRGRLMEFHDKVLKCSECNSEFVFTAGEQMFFADKGFKNEPKRCKNCKANRAQGSNGTSSTSVQRVETKTVC